MILSPNLKRLLVLLLPHRWRILLAFVGMGIIAATEPALVWMIKTVVDRGFAKPSTLPLWTVPAFLTTLFIVRGAATFATGYLMAWVSTRLLSELQQKAFAHLLRAPAGFYEQTPVGTVINAMAYEAKQCLELVERVIIKFFRSLFTALSLIAYLAYLDWKLGVITMLFIAPFMLILRVTGKRYSKATASYIHTNSELAKMVGQAAAGHHALKLSGQARAASLPFSQLTERLREHTVSMYRVVGTQVPLTQLLGAIALAFVLVVHQIAPGQHTTGEFVAFLTNMLLLLAPMRSLAEVSGALLRGWAGTDAIFAIIDAPGERAMGRVISGRAAGKLEFVNVSFNYAGRTAPAVSHLSLTIQPGQIVALVGMSGAGKSTLARMVPEFLCPTEGEIRLDGVPTSKLSLDSLRSQIAMVSQDTVLIDASIAANIALGDDTPSMERISAALQVAQLGPTIAALPDGIETMIGKNGLQLSGGQRQRLAIARAIYKDAPILLLDEPTAALDSETARNLQDELVKLMQQKTTLLITHQRWALEKADRIIVMDQGSIAEAGTHRELLGKDGLYARLQRVLQAG